jgi:hypothetical protein
MRVSAKPSAGSERAERVSPGVDRALGEPSAVVAALDDRMMRRALPAALGGIGALAILSWLVVLVVHLGDRYEVGHVAGAWMALAANAEGGVLYPELFDGERYGGTRNMPMFFTLHAGLARVTGEYLISGKLLTLGFALLLLSVVFLALRRLGCSRPVALGMTALIVLTATGLRTSATIRGDVAAVALQIAAIEIAMRRRRDVWLGAAVTAALFALGKFLIGLYLGRSGVSSVFGAAGSLVAVMVWVYYSAQIFLLGAEFTKLESEHAALERTRSHDPRRQPDSSGPAPALHPRETGRPALRPSGVSEVPE